jgi:hypothetical protein
MRVVSYILSSWSASSSRFQVYLGYTDHPWPSKGQDEKPRRITKSTYGLCGRDWEWATTSPDSIECPCEWCRLGKQAQTVEAIVENLSAASHVRKLYDSASRPVSYMLTCPATSPNCTYIHLFTPSLFSHVPSPFILVTQSIICMQKNAKVYGPAHALDTDNVSSCWNPAETIWYALVVDWFWSHCVCPTNQKCSSKLDLRLNLACYNRPDWRPGRKQRWSSKMRSKRANGSNNWN